MSGPDPFAKYADKLTDDQFRRVHATMEELGLKRTDALFHVMAALDYYRVLYEDVPARIKAAGDNALEAVNEAARLQGEREIVAARVSLAEEVAATARKLSLSRDRLNLWIVAFFATFMVLAATIGAFLIGRLSAYNSYRAETNSVAIWFNSSDGQYANYLSRHGVLSALELCRARNRTFAIGPTEVQCGVMVTPMRDAKPYKPLPTGDTEPVKR